MAHNTVCLVAGYIGLHVQIFSGEPLANWLCTLKSGSVGLIQVVVGG